MSVEKKTLSCKSLWQYVVTNESIRLFLFSFNFLCIITLQKHPFQECEQADAIFIIELDGVLKLKQRWLVSSVQCCIKIFVQRSTILLSLMMIFADLLGDVRRSCYTRISHCRIWIKGNRNQKSNEIIRACMINQLTKHTRLNSLITTQEIVIFSLTDKKRHLWTNNFIFIETVETINVRIHLTI